MACVEVINNISVDSAIDNIENSLDIKSSGWVNVPIVLDKNLPECIKKRINALKNIQLHFFQLEGKFYEEAHQLEMRYAEQLKVHFQKRSDIVNGLYEPNDKEASWIEPDENHNHEEQKENNAEIKEEKENEVIVKDITSHTILNEDTIGIPGFWLTAMKNAVSLQGMIRKYDEDILKHLVDMKVKLTGKQNESDDKSGNTDDIGFILEFIFSENDYFHNTSLIKGYAVDMTPDAEDPFCFDGPHIVASAGCRIEWNEGKDVTQRAIKSKQKRKGHSETKLVKSDSFFNFFAPLQLPDNPEDLDEEIESVIVFDFEIGNFFREEFIPKAVLYYTGEVNDGDSDSEGTQSSIEIIEDNDDGDEETDDTSDSSENEKMDTNQANCKQQ